MDSTNNPGTPNPLGGVGAPSTPAATPAPEAASTAPSAPVMGTVIPAPADVPSVAASTGGDNVAEALKRIEDKLNAIATKVGA